MHPLKAFAVVLLACSSVQSQTLPVIPQPTSWRPAGRATFPLPKILRVSGSSAAAHALIEDWRLVRGKGAAVSSGIAAADVVFAPYENQFKDEAYRIEIAPGRITVRASASRGEYWATRTLIQLFRAGTDVPCGVVDDCPKYAYRGFMLDVARKSYTIGFLMQLAHNLAYYKMNVFHIHLNDDGAYVFMKEGCSRFRLECETCPELTAKDFHYTKAEFRAFMKRAAAIGVTVIPEIDTPAHSGSITKVHPEFASKKYGGSHLTLDNPAVVEFMDRLFAEYLAGPDPVFAGPFFHVGTDEYDKRAAEPFRAYTDKMLRLARKYGRTPCAWGALTHAAGETPVLSEGVVMDIWHNPYYNPLKAIEDGYRIVSVPDNLVYIVPAAGYYRDYLDCKWLFENWEPCNIRDVTLPSDHPQLLGGKFAFWNDISGNGISEDDTFDRVFPALQTLSQKMWTGKCTEQGWVAFSALADKTGEAPGVNQSDCLTGPNMTLLPRDMAVGWSQKGGYTVSFKVRPDRSGSDAVLFDDGFSKVRFFEGRIGFERDGVSFAYPFAPETGRWTQLVFIGDAKGVELMADGKSIGVSAGERGYAKNWCGSGKERWFDAPRTLHFPLRKVSVANTIVKDLKVKVGKP